MKLTVRLFAHLRERAGRSEIVLEDLAEDLDVAGLKREIERREPAIGSLARVRGAVGTEYAAETRRLKDGETVSLIPPVSGGAFRLSEQPLSLEAAVDEVRNDQAGAIATFTGTTRIDTVTAHS